MRSLSLVLVAALAACAAPHPASTTVTSATVAAPQKREASAFTDAAREEGVRRKAVTPPGTIVCKAKDAFGVMTELFVEHEGEGDDIPGSLRSVAPTGNVYLQAVRIQRHGGKLLVDEPGEVDLFTHVATVATIRGKQHMRLGQVWAPCE